MSPESIVHRRAAPVFALLATGLFFAALLAPVDLLPIEAGVFARYLLGSFAVPVAAFAGLTYVAGRNEALQPAVAAALAALGFGLALVRLAAWGLSAELRDSLGPMLIGEVFALTALGAWASMQHSGAGGLARALAEMKGLLPQLRGLVRLEIVLALPVLFIGPLVFIQSHPAQVWMLSQVVNTGIALAVMGNVGRNRLIALGHLLPWLVPIAATALALPDADGALRLWLLSALVVGPIVWLIDLRELLLWWGGNTGLDLADG